jgi:hypothetical protein
MKEHLRELEGDYYISYNTVTELEIFMEQLKWNEKNHLHKVIIYRTGYFIQ